MQQVQTIVPIADVILWQRHHVDLHQCCEEPATNWRKVDSHIGLTRLMMLVSDLPESDSIHCLRKSSNILPVALQMISEFMFLKLLPL